VEKRNAIPKERSTCSSSFETMDSLLIRDGKGFKNEMGGSRQSHTGPNVKKNVAP
jgi:hypothetical protein